MSYGELLAVYPHTNTPAQELFKYGNSQGLAAVIWSIFCTDHLHVPRNQWLSDCYSKKPTIDKIFKMAKDTSLALSERAVLRMTCDYAYIRAENLLKASSDIQDFFSHHKYSPEYVNHWHLIANQLKSIDASVPAVAFYHTSWGDNLWKEWDEERNCVKETDWSRTFEIYDKLEAEMDVWRDEQ